MTGNINRLRREDWLAIGGLIVLLVACQVIGDYGTDLLAKAFAAVGIEHQGARVAVAIIALAMVAVGWLALSRSHPRPGMARQTVIASLTLITLVLSNAAPSWFEEAIGLDSQSSLFRITAGVLTVLVWVALSVYLLPEIQQRFQTPIDLAISDDVERPHGAVVLIMLVSRVDFGRYLLSLGESGEPGATLEVSGTCGISNHQMFRLGCDSLSGDIAGLSGSNWPWQQILRAVDRYTAQNGLRIMLVGSKASDAADESGGSFEQLPLLISYLKRYPELMNAVVERLPGALDFERFNEVKETIRACIRAQVGCVSETNVFVDITGGQKVASAAAAVATIGTMGRFQYVQTNKPYRVRVSDLHPQVSPSVGT